MAYIPPHKRHSGDKEKPRPTPAKLVPAFGERLSLGRQARKEESPLQSGRIVYAKDSISGWLLVGLTDDGHIPPSVNLEEQMERQNGKKPLALVRDRAHPDAYGSSHGSSNSPWLLIGEKILPHLYTSVQNVRRKLDDEESGTGPVKSSFVARFGKVHIDGGHSISLDKVLKSAVGDSGSFNQLRNSFNTNIPNSFMEFVQDVAVPELGLDFESEKQYYTLRIFDNRRPRSTISCKCSVKKDMQGLEIFKAELNPVRHLVTDISCLDKDLDLRLMLFTKRLLTSLSDEEEQGIRQLVKSAIIDPNVKGGLRWPLGSESFLDRFSVVGVWHLKCRIFTSPIMRLKLRDADRFDFKTSTGESAKEVTLKLTGLSRALNDEKADQDRLGVILQEMLRSIWDNILCCDCAFT